MAIVDDLVALDDDHDEAKKGHTAQDNASQAIEATKHIRDATTWKNDKAEPPQLILMGFSRATVYVTTCRGIETSSSARRPTQTASRLTCSFLRWSLRQEIKRTFDSDRSSVVFGLVPR
ncbi:hypothetical protein AC1031_017063 [Aphanomyces cochlioides]|nr:hypothetical protein AC1031_017063 [Aphanomyces cochlioides]